MKKHALIIAAGTLLIGSLVARSASQAQEIAELTEALEWAQAETTFAFEEYREVKAELEALEALQED